MDIDLVSVTEAMQITNLSKSQVLWLCNNGRLDAKKVGNTWVIELQALASRFCCRMAATARRGKEI